MSAEQNKDKNNVGTNTKILVLDRVTLQITVDYFNRNFVAPVTLIEISNKIIC